MACYQKRAKFSLAAGGASPADRNDPPDWLLLNFPDVLGIIQTQVNAIKAFR
jgi:hypothetical protein